MKKAVQKFDKKVRSEKLTPEETVRFLEDYRITIANISDHKSKLISLKVPESLLNAFRLKAQTQGIKYQTKIKELMLAWLTQGG